jgi:hypothetical protein
LDTFGTERAFEPLTLDGALRDDHDELLLGVARIVTGGKRDTRGRAIILYDPSRLQKGTYTTKGILRVFWYMLHVALSDPMVQKHGIVVLVNTRHMTYHNFNRHLTQSMLSAMKAAVPVRISAFFIAYPSPILSMILPIAKAVMNERMRKRIVMVGSSENEILQTLYKSYGLRQDMLPTDVGGLVHLDVTAWLQQQAALGM